MTDHDEADCTEPWYHDRHIALAGVAVLEPDFQEVLEWFDDGLLTQEEIWRIFKIDVGATAWNG